jgi:hypothetical protein
VIAKMKNKKFTKPLKEEMNINSSSQRTFGPFHNMPTKIFSQGVCRWWAWTKLVRRD